MWVNVLSDIFPLQNGSKKKGGGLSQLVLNFALEYAILKMQKRGIETQLGTLAPDPYL
jgi:hypothetical protein